MKRRAPAKRKGLPVLIKDDCANYRSGACLGAYTGHKASAFGHGLRDGDHFARWLPKCGVRLGLPCAYFEKCLLPAVRRREGGPSLVAEYRAGVADDIGEALAALEDEALAARYEKHPFTRHLDGSRASGAVGRFCPECESVALAPGKRYCTPCRGKRAKAAQGRARKRLRNKGGGQ